MTLERDISDLLSSVRGYSFNTAGSMSDRVKEGIQDAGLVDAVADVGAIVKSQGTDNAAALASIAAAVGIASEKICSELRESNSFLKSIESASLNPIETEARELYRRGIHALSRGWAEESIDALNLALEKNPLTPEVHASIAVAKILDGDAAGAEPALKKAIRYSTPDFPELAAGANLLLANVHEQSGRSGEAANILRSAASSFPNCPEVAFSLARLTDGREGLAQALGLAPEFGVLALSLPTWPSDAQSAVAEAATPAFATGRQIREALARFGDSFERPIATKWTYDFGSGAKGDLLAAAESLDYLRRNIRDVWKLAKWGRNQSSGDIVQWRVDMVEYFTLLTEKLRRLRPWKQPGDTADPAKLARQPDKVLYMRPPSPLVIPGGPHDDPSIEAVRIPGEIVQLVDLGAVEKASQRLAAMYPWLDESGAKHVLTYKNPYG